MPLFTRRGASIDETSVSQTNIGAGATHPHGGLLGMTEMWGCALDIVYDIHTFKHVHMHVQQDMGTGQDRTLPL